MRRSKSYIMLGLIFLILVSSLLISVDSLGITPGRTNLEYVDGLEKTVQFSVLNNEREEMEVIIMVAGELNESISLDINRIEFLPSEESKSLNYTIRLSDDIKNVPGLHTAEIMALKVPKANSDGKFVGSTVGVVTQLHVFVPCPGKCVTADMHIFDAEKDSIATFVVPVINKGKVGINDARAVVDIFYPNNEKVTTVESNIKSIDPEQRVELAAKWNVSVPEGDYKAKVVVLYDGEAYVIEKEFSVGSKKLTIENIFVNNFRLGEISKLQVLVENHWNQELTGVYANMLVYDNDDQVMADIRSSNENIPALSKKELILYWDTYGVRVGEYSANLLVKYNEKSSERNLVLKVSDDSLDVFGVGYTVKPQGSKGVNLTFILIVLVVLMMVVNLAWFIMFKRVLSTRKK